VLEALTPHYDLVIIDSPPVQLFADAPLLSSYVDGTLLVIEARRGRRAKVRQCADTLQRAGTTIVGVLINRTKGEGHPVYGYYAAKGDTATAETALSSSATSAASTTPGTSRERRGNVARSAERDQAPSGIKPG
jgi:Mrp family chromosome partitioning ATPase